MKKTYLFSLVAVALCIGFTACSDDDEDANTTTTPEDFETVFADITSDYVTCTVIPTYKGMADNAIELYKACYAMLEAGTDSLTTELIDAADECWLETRRYWEQSEAWLYGPVDYLNVDPHIDSWPLEQETLQKYLGNSTTLQSIIDNPTEFFTTSSNYGTMGFHAAEYMLFETVGSGASQRSQARSVSKYTTQELQFLVAVVEDLRNYCVYAEAAWVGYSNVSSEKQAYLNTAGLSSYISTAYSSYMTAPSTSNTYYNNYLNVAEEIIVAAQDIADEVQGQKIGNPIGHGSDATSEDYNDPDYIESPYSLNSIQDFQNNIISIRNFYQGWQSTIGTTTLGTDSYITASNNTISDYVASLDSDLDTRVKAAIVNAYDKIGLMEEPFSYTATASAYEEINLNAQEACVKLRDILGDVYTLLEAQVQ